jgi:hypothetical protein
MVEWYISDELERIQKEVVMAWLRYSLNICLVGLRKIMKDLSQDTWYIVWDLNWAPLEYKSVTLTLPLHQPALSWNIYYFEVRSMYVNLPWCTDCSCISVCYISQCVLSQISDYMWFSLIIEFIWQLLLIVYYTNNYSTFKVFLFCLIFLYPLLGNGLQLKITIQRHVQFSLACHGISKGMLSVHKSRQYPSHGHHFFLGDIFCCVCKVIMNSWLCCIATKSSSGISTQNCRVLRFPVKVPVKFWSITTACWMAAGVRNVELVYSALFPS